MPDSAKDELKKHMGTMMQAMGNASELLAKSDEELAAEWAWSWDDKASTAWNVYTFSAALERHKRRCRLWEEHHNGAACVVERVCVKYLLPRVREFLKNLGEDE